MGIFEESILDKPIYDSVTGAPLNYSAFALEMEEEMKTCEHCKNFDWYYEECSLPKDEDGFVKECTFIET